METKSFVVYFLYEDNFPGEVKSELTIVNGRLNSEQCLLKPKVISSYYSLISKQTVCCHIRSLYQMALMGSQLSSC